MIWVLVLGIVLIAAAAGLFVYVYKTRDKALLEEEMR